MLHYTVDYWALNKWSRRILQLVRALSNVILNIWTHVKVTFVLLHLLTTEWHSKQVFWATVYIKKSEHVLWLERSKNSSAASKFWCHLKQFSFPCQRRCFMCFIMLMRLAWRESSSAISFSAAAGISAFFSELLGWLCTVWGKYEHIVKDWGWELCNFLPTSVRSFASWPGRPGKRSLLCDFVVPSCLHGLHAVFRGMEYFQSFMNAFLWALSI